MKQLIFVSSVQGEFAAERRAIRDFVHGNRLLGKHFEVFLFEDLAATDRRPDDEYLNKVDSCAVFIAILGAEYGRVDPKDSLSPTEREFRRATQSRRRRLVFLKNLRKAKPHPKMAALIARTRTELVYKRFDDAAALTSMLYDSLIDTLEESGTIQSKPFDAAPCPGASLADIAGHAIRWFLPIARRERNLKLAASASKRETLTHLKLADGDGVTHAAVLLFGAAPQRFAPSAVVKCAHYHGTEIAKPIPSHQVIEGTLFEQVDGATNFVMSRLARRVGTREMSAAAPVTYELPREAIAEIIVNAVAHRDYTSHASVQVSVFADRIEAWNPGRLPRGLRPEDLTKPHSSEPANPLVARPLYLAHYIENLGTGTLDVIRHCREAGLPQPDFEQRGHQFVVTLWRDWLTADVVASFHLNERQTVAVPVLRQQQRITTGRYQQATGASRATAKRDLEDLVGKGLLVPAGAGRGAYYELAKNGLRNGSIGSSPLENPNGSETAQTAQPRRRSGGRQRPARGEGAAKAPKGPAAREPVTKRRKRE